MAVLGASKKWLNATFLSFTGFASHIRSRAAKPAKCENLWVFIRSDAHVVRAGLNIRGCGPLSTPWFFDSLKTVVWPSFLHAVIYSSFSSDSSLGFNVMTAESIWWDSILSMWTVSLSSSMVMFWGPSTGIMPSLSNTSPVRVS